MGVANFVCLKAIFSHKAFTDKELDAIVDDAMKLSGGLFRPTPPAGSA
jgi:hypothetical protein